VSNVIVDVARTEQKKGKRQFAVGTVVSVSTSGVSVAIEGDGTSSAKKYKRNLDVAFSAGDRVLCVRISGTYVIVCRIG
jgi:hypothetical protein